jgi:C_GCAxxG_C_C family probable redox protein
MAGLTAVMLPAAPAAGAEAGPKELDPDELEALADARFIADGRTCCESVVMAGCEALGVECGPLGDAAIAMAGGVGLQGGVCGIVSGAAMVIGVAVAARETQAPKRVMRSAEAVQAFCRAFEERFGSTECLELCGLDLTTPQGRKALKTEVKPGTCRRYMRAAAHMLAEAANDA